MSEAAWFKLYHFKLYYFSLGERILVGGLSFLVFFINSLDCHAGIVSVRPVGIVNVYKTGLNIKKFCDPLFTK